MIGITVLDKEGRERTIYDDLSFFSFSIDENNRKIEVYHNEEDCGSFISQIGMNEDEFVSKAKNRSGE